MWYVNSPRLESRKEVFKSARVKYFKKGIQLDLAMFNLRGFPRSLFFKLIINQDFD
jgi:hypothetical protein